MASSLRRVVVAVLVASVVILPASQVLAAPSVADLGKLIRQMADQEAKIAKEREATFRNKLQKQQQLVRQAVARRNADEARGNELNRQFDANSKRLKEMKALLKEHEGNLGELFGVTRQIAGDAANVLQQSMLTVEYPAAKGQKDRVDFLVGMAAEKSLPSIDELERMWFELQREMTENGKVERFKAPVLQKDGSSKEMEVVRVGPFTAVSGGTFLGYLPGEKSLTVLDRPMPPRFRSIARKLADASPNAGYQRAVVDPARGALLGRYVDRPNFIERIENGEAVGYFIIAVGLIGALLAIVQYVYLFITRAAVNKQLRGMSSPQKNNPLGRVMLKFRGDGKKVDNAEVAELRLSEAILHEVPKLERFQSFLRLAVAAGPLMGLVGTVIGMIITFHAITASGSSDPRLMAHGIGQAMIATVLGLGIAIPLLFINAGLTTLSSGVTQILDEQGEALLAAHISGSGRH